MGLSFDPSLVIWYRIAIAMEKFNDSLSKWCLIYATLGPILLTGLDLSCPKILWSILTIFGDTTETFSNEDLPGSFCFPDLVVNQLIVVSFIPHKFITSS